ncbi:multiple sugar transport system permease protein [Paenibacillus sp. yr247]|uniref:carbohydrate ABC transporter permease n=1 Tax=Paenibacillus sp. yr247 TaxID=1761880 RepID=UPI0008853E68|nr:sugar ABC transporter permease [Paenibacillus sp. yr247]SDN95185.1 multiple sugar transport system permease protein [Paenibacillus sp. yr247]
MESDTAVTFASSKRTMKPSFWKKLRGQTASDEKPIGYLFILPASLHLMVFVIYPILFALYLSFHKWSILKPDKPFVGLGNYKKLLDDTDFWIAMKHTFYFVAGSVPTGIAISLLVALVLNRKMRGVYWFRTIFFLPVISSTVAIAMVWQWILQPEFGLLNFMLSKVGIHGIKWLLDPNWAMIAVIIVSVWKGIGYQMIIFIAGLQGIPDHLYEAARIDGASKWRMFWSVTVPLLMPTLFFLAVTSVISSFQVFTVVYMLTEGGPLGSTDVVVYHIYDQAFKRFNMGYASSQSYVLFAVIFAVTMIQIKVMKRFNYEY